MLRYVSGMSANAHWKGFLLDIKTTNAIVADRAASWYALEHGLSRPRVRSWNIPGRALDDVVEPLPEHYQGV